MITLLLYLGLLGITSKAWMVEHRDIHCPTLDSSEEECERGQAMAFSWTRPLPEDDPSHLLDKISKAAGAETNLIKWRRTLILSVGIVSLIWVIALRRVPWEGDWRELMMAILLCYLTLFTVENYYSYHLFREARNNIREAVDRLRGITRSGEYDG